MPFSRDPMVDASLPSLRRARWGALALAIGALLVASIGGIEHATSWAFFAFTGCASLALAALTRVAWMSWLIVRRRSSG